LVVRGVILAGGTGSRFAPATQVMNKHLLPVYRTPMIYYPINTLVAMGCTDVLIVTGGEHIGAFSELLGRGVACDITYRVQTHAGGIAQALGCARGYVTDPVFPVILGDNYFQLRPVMGSRPTLYTHYRDNVSEFGVLYDRQIIEKPATDQPGNIVTGLYVYDQRVFDVIRTLKPSDRNELEITDVNNWYLRNDMDVAVINGHWADMGTPESLLDLVLWMRNRGAL